MLWPKTNGIYFYSKTKKNPNQTLKWQKSLFFKSDITKSQYISSMFAIVFNIKISWAAFSYLSAIHFPWKPLVEISAL